MASFLFVIICSLFLLILNDVDASFNWTLATEKACFSSTTFLRDYTFNPPHAGHVDAVKLIHTSGGVTCYRPDWPTTGWPLTNWGCLYKNVEHWYMVQLVRHNDNETVDTVLPTIHSLNVSGWSQSTAYNCSHGCNVYYYNKDQDNTTSNELILAEPSLDLYVAQNDTFSLQYSESCCGWYNYDNAGTSCAEVYFGYASKSETSSDKNTIESWLPLILLIVVILMIVIMAIVVACLLWRRKNIRSRNVMEMPIIPEAPSERRETVRSRTMSQSDAPEGDIEGRVEGMETWTGNQTIHGDYVMMSDA